jgi:hypothetical protein
MPARVVTTFIKIGTIQIQKGPGFLRDGKHAVLIYDMISSKEDEWLCKSFPFFSFFYMPAAMKDSIIDATEGK